MNPTLSKRFCNPLINANEVVVLPTCCFVAATKIGRCDDGRVAFVGVRLALVFVDDDDNDADDVEENDDNRDDDVDDDDDDGALRINIRELIIEELLLMMATTRRRERK